MLEMHEWINRPKSTHFKLSLIQFPSGKWGFVGTIPVDLTRERTDHLGFTVRDSRVYETEAAACQDAKSNGFELGKLYRR